MEVDDGEGSQAPKDTQAVPQDEAKTIVNAQPEA